MVFGRRKRQHNASSHELTKLGKRAADRADGGEKRCRAESCAFSAALEASRFRAEATGNDDKWAEAGAAGGSSSSTWGGHSALYDSFELDSFSHKLGRSLAQERSSRQRVGRRANAVAPPRWHSRRLSGSISCFPSCFSKRRTPTIQLGKKRGPTLQGAFHVVAKLARHGCHVIAGIPACSRGQLGGGGGGGGRVHISQTHHHYHHHVHHRVALEQKNDSNLEISRPAMARSPLLHFDDPAFCLSPHSLHAYLPLQEMMDHHLTSIKYQP